MAWNFGNTSVRNPYRIQGALRVYERTLNGNLVGIEQEALLRSVFIAEGIIKAGDKEPKQPELHGRKWRSCFAKLGFITGHSYYAVGDRRVTREEVASQGLDRITTTGYEVTPVGRRLIGTDSPGAVSDIFLRQLLRLELPSPTEEERIGPVKPFVLLLQLLGILEQRDQPGLNKVEVAAFAHTAVSHDGLPERVDRLLAYRQQRASIPGKRDKRRFDNETIEKERDASGLTSPAVGSLKGDYSDTTFRYSRMTGLLSLKGSRLTLRKETHATVDAILETEPQFLATENPLAYLADFYTGTSIPTDNADTAIQEIRVFEQLLVEQGLQPSLDYVALAVATPQDLATTRHEIEEQYQLVREVEFARKQATDDDQLDEILAYLGKLNGADDENVVIEDEPAFLEWSVWRALLAMNTLSVHPSKTRNFKLDVDLRPVDHAPGGRPDIVMDYGDFLIVVEVTMSGGSRQEAMEGEPVRRHIADVMESFPDREVYGLFVAPAVDYNTAETFRAGIWYKNADPHYLNIVPLTLSQLMDIVKCMRPVRWNPTRMKSLLDRCLIFRNALAPSWMSKISGEVGSCLASVPPSAEG